MIRQDERHLHANCLFYIITVYRKCLLLQFLGCSIHMHISTLMGVRNRRITSWKKTVIPWKRKFFLKLNFQAKHHLDTYYLFYILAICLECLLFCILNWDISVHFAIVIEVQKGRIKSRRNGDVFLKNTLLKVNF